MPCARAQNDLKGIVRSRREEDPGVGPVRKLADAQKELSAIAHAAGGQGLLAQLEQGRPVIENEGAGVRIAGRRLKQRQQGVPDPELHGLVRRLIAVGQDVEPQHLPGGGGRGNIAPAGGQQSHPQQQGQA